MVHQDVALFQLLLSLRTAVRVLEMMVYLFLQAGQFPVSLLSQQLFGELEGVSDKGSTFVGPYVAPPPMPLCPVDPDLITYDAYQLRQADAVLFSCLLVLGLQRFRLLPDGVYPLHSMVVRNFGALPLLFSELFSCNAANDCRHGFAASCRPFPYLLLPDNIVIKLVPQ